MTEVAGTEELERRLALFGEALAFDDAHLADVVLERLDAAPPTPARHRWLAAAAVLVLVLAGIALYPDSRHAVARWFGLEGVTVEVDPELSTTATSSPPAFGLPGPGESEVVVVDGREILVSTVSGSLTDELIVKTVGSAAQIEQVEVNGRRGLWISGTPHEVLYASPEGRVAVERVAANTLLWEGDGVLSRVEGFEQLSDALAFAEGT